MGNVGMGNVGMGNGGMGNGGMGGHVIVEVDEICGSERKSFFWFDVVALTKFSAGNMILNK